MFWKIVIAIFLGRKQQYLKVVKVKKRNVLIQIEEYIPATELLQKLDD